MNLRWGMPGVLVALFPLAAWPAQCPERTSYQSLDLGYRIERLSPDSPDWTDVDLQYQNIFGRHGVLARVTQSSRFDQSDTTATLGGHWAPTDSDTLSAEGSYGPSHHVLPRSSLQGSWNHAWGGGWGTQLGVRQTDYATTSLTLGEVMLERYLGNFRWAYTYGPSHSTTAGSSASHRVQGGYYYGTFSSVQALLVAGDEVDQPTSATTVTETHVRSAAVFGLQQLGCDWGLGWSLSYTQTRAAVDGSRRGAGLFVQRRF